jgi:glycosyltransferase involved in cell wall biosynthesis
MNPIIDTIIPTIRTQDEVAPLVAELHATAGIPVRVIVVSGPGKSAAHNRNAGLDQCTSDFVCMVDDDMERFPQGWLTKLVAVLEEHPECVMVSARLVRPDGSPGIMMGAADLAVRGVTVARQRMLPTACVVIRRNSLRYDEAYIGSGFEDTDHCYQLHKMYPDCTFLVLNDVRVVHRNEMKSQGEPWWSHNKAHFIAKWGVNMWGNQ